MSGQNTGRIVGLGGVFVTSSDPEKTKAWYRDVLGVNVTDYGANFAVRNEVAAKEAYTVWSVFPDTTDYLKPSEQNFMINFRVENLEDLLSQLAVKGVEVVGDMVSEPYGKFAWIMDPDGLKVELWEQVGPAPTE